MTFEELRAHLGMETQRQWSERAIARTTPALFVSIFRVIRPAIFTDIQPPWERGELTIIRL